MSPVNHFKTPYYYFRSFECCLGIICLALFTDYFTYIDDETETLAMFNFKTGLANVAAYGFPFLVQIPFLIAFWRHGLPFQHNILNPIVNLVGVVVYVTSGSLLLSWIVPNASSKYDAVADWFRQQFALGSMLIVTGAVYLIDLIFWYAKLRQDPNL